MTKDAEKVFEEAVEKYAGKDVNALAWSFDRTTNTALIFKSKRYARGHFNLNKSHDEIVDDVKTYLSSSY